MYHLIRTYSLYFIYIIFGGKTARLGLRFNFGGLIFTAVFNNMRTLKFKPTSQDAFFAAVNQISGGFRLLPTATGKARGLSNKHGSQIWIFFAVESGVFACDSSSLSRGDSSLVESRKNICS